MEYSYTLHNISDFLSITYYVKDRLLDGELRLSLFYYRTQIDVFVYEAALKRHLVHEGRFL